jgi:hypothetical protein
MTNKEISNSIFENYYSLLELYSKINACNYNNLGFCKSITNTKTTWPNFIFDVKDFTETQINNLINGIKNKEFADVVLTNNYFAKNDSILINKGFKKVAVWNAMALNLSEYKQTTENYKLDIKLVKSEQEITDWINIVKQELKINFSINEVQNLINEASINLFIGYYNNVAVSTALIYTNNNIVGHYMIATLKNYTKKGFGFEIMQYSLNYSNAKIAVLASSLQGEKLYNKLNYTSLDVFNLYWLLPS